MTTTDKPVIIPTLLCRLLLAFLIAMTAVSCGSHRTQSSGTGQSYTPAISGASDTLIAMYETLIQSYSPQWQKLEVPVSVKVSGLPVSLSGTAYMERGKTVAISLRMLGMEVAAGLITNDSVVIVDRYHNRHMTAPLSILTKSFPVKLENIQDIMLGRIFDLGSADINGHDGNLKLSSDPDLKDLSRWYILPQLPETLPVDYAFVMDPRPSLIQLVAGLPGNRTLTAEYAAPERNTTYGPIAPTVNVNLQGGDGKNGISGRLQWKTDKIRFNDQARNVKVTVPYDSKPIDPSSMAKILGGATR